MPDSENGYINVGGAKLYYGEAGQGKPLVLVHAGFVDSRMWDDQWDEFAQHYRVIRFDMRGFGKSDRAEAPISRRDDLYRVLKQLNIPRTVLLGCSLGGEVCLDFTVEHPEMVSALILVSTVPGGFELQGEPPPELIEMMAAIQQGDLPRASELQNRLWIDGPSRQPDQVDARLHAQAAEMERIALANQTFIKVDAAPLNPLDPPAEQRLMDLHVLTLVIAGRLDNPEILRAAGVMATAIPAASKVFMPDCAHMLNMEQPAKFNQIVLNFLGNVL